MGNGGYNVKKFVNNLNYVEVYKIANYWFLK